jgi:hypothetical protein
MAVSSELSRYRLDSVGVQEVRSPTSGGRSVGIVCLQTKSHGVCFLARSQMGGQWHQTSRKTHISLW